MSPALTGNKERGGVDRTQGAEHPFSTCGSPPGSWRTILQVANSHCLMRKYLWTAERVMVDLKILDSLTYMCVYHV